MRRHTALHPLVNRRATAWIPTPTADEIAIQFAAGYAKLIIMVAARALQNAPSN